MKDPKIQLNPNQLVQFLDKMPEDFTREDIVRFIEGNNIKMVNFRYVAADGKLKTLSFVITSRNQLDQILTSGERVDGSSLFPYVDAASSDLYVIPKYKTAFVNPFTPIPTLDILCSYFNNEGRPLESSPEYTVKKAHEALKKETGLSMEALGELEYYVFYDKSPIFQGAAQKGYHESPPFVKWEYLRSEAMLALAQAGSKLKYAHSEVGNIKDEIQGMEQHEIELHPTPIEDAADQVALAKWVLRMVGWKHGVNISFAPKVLVGHAGSGLHVHMRLLKDGKSVMIENGKLSDTARKAIAGVLDMAPSLTSFSNTIPTSYLRLVPHQEAPTNICWGDRNRSVLVRVPLGWVNVGDMGKTANPQDTSPAVETPERQTFEFRVPDGSADIHLTIAGLAVAVRHGIQMKDALSMAQRLYVDVNIFNDAYKHIQEKLPQLPASCWDSADHLLKQREIYEQSGVFSKILIDGVVKKLKSYEDKDLSERLFGNSERIKDLVMQHLHCS